MTTSTTSNHLHTTSMEAVKLTTSTTSTTSIDGGGGVEVVKRSERRHHLQAQPHPPKAMSLAEAAMSLPWWVMGRIAAALAAIAAGLTTLTLWCVARAGARPTPTPPPKNHRRN